MTEPELIAWVDSWMSHQPLDGSHGRLGGLVKALSDFDLEDLTTDALAALAAVATITPVPTWEMTVITLITNGYPTNKSGALLYRLWRSDKLTSCGGTVRIGFP